MKSLILFLMVIFLASCATTKDATTGMIHINITNKYLKKIINIVVIMNLVFVKNKAVA